MIEQADLWCRDCSIQSPAGGDVERLVRSARRAFEDAFLERIPASLNAETVARMESSLADPDGAVGFNTMKAPGRCGLPSRLDVATAAILLRRLPSRREHFCPGELADELSKKSVG